MHPETERIDYDEMERLAKEYKPKLIVGGASAYPRVIDFERMAEIAHEVGAYLMIDMAHIAGLVATGAHPSPVPYADIVTSTSHQDPAWSARWIHPHQQRRARYQDRQGGVPWFAGWPAHARDRGQGGRVPRGAAPEYATYIVTW